MTTKLDDIALNELCSLIQEKKIIVPFAKNSFPLPNADKNVVYVDLSGYSEIEDYCVEDRTLSVQCGIKVKQLQEFLASNKQWLPVAYAAEETSLLDLILTGDAGLFEAVFGGLRRHILGLTFILANGDIAKSGGKVVKNVSGYDLTRFLIGSYGHFAIPIKANLKVYALPQKTLSIVVEGNNFGDLLELAKETLYSSVSVACLEIVDSKLLDEAVFLKELNVASRFVLALQIYGDTDIVQDGMDKVLNRLTQKKLTHLEVVEQDNLLQYLTFLTMPMSNSHQLNLHKNGIIDLALNIEECLRFSQERELSVFPFVYRPSSNRWRYYLDSQTEKNIVLDLLTKYAKKRLTPLTVAYNDDNYIKRVSRLGSDVDNEERVISDIKQRLKNALDPDNLFNPFVKL